MPYARWDKERGFYALAGQSAQGTPAVLIHGAGGNHLAWPPAMRRLSGRPTYAIDLPGHGRTPPPGRQSVSDFSEWLLSMLQAIGLSSSVWIGHSMGAAIALDAALKAPEYCAGLVLIGGGARMPVSPAILAGLQSDFAATVEQITRFAYGPNTPAEMKRIGQDQMALVGPCTLYGDFLACAGFDVTTRLGEIHQPSLILCGSADRMMPPRYSIELHERLAGSELVIIPGAGHMVTFEQPEIVARAIAHFCNNLLTVDEKPE